MNYKCLNKYTDSSNNRFENRHNKYEYVHSSSRLERLKYDTIMRTNKKNKEALSKRCNENSINSKNKQVRTGVKNGRYAGTKERFTGWMFNVYHKEKTICTDNNCYQKLSDPKKRHVHLCLPLANRTRINKN